MAHFVPTLLIALATTCAAGSTTAQSCGVRNGFRIVNSHSGAGSELAVDTGWQTTGPLTTPGANDNTGPVCASQGTCTPTSDYGYLRVVGSGTANNCPMSGVFLWLDQVPQARFLDTMTVTSATLPQGTPVQVRVAVALDGFATMVDSSPYVDYSAIVTGGSLGMTVANAPGTTTGILSTSVGGSVQLQAGLSATLYGYGMLGLGIPPAYFSYSVDLTAHVGVDCLTPGATLNFCSGRSYATLASEVHAVAGGCGTGSPVLTATLPMLGQTQNYTITGATPGEAAFFGYSIGPAVNAPLGPCTIALDGTSLDLSFAAITDAAGSCSFGRLLPTAPIFAGLRLTTQALVLTNGGPLLGFAQLTNGLEMTIGF